MSRVKRLLVPTDFSPTSNIAFSYALDMAAREGASIRLLHVIEDASFAAAYPDGLFVEVPGLREKLIEEAQKRLEIAVKACAAAQVTATTQVLVGPPASCITGEANACGTDLIVMGTHSKGRLARTVSIGKLAQHLLVEASCDVLTSRP